MSSIFSTTEASQQQQLAPLSILFAKHVLKVGRLLYFSTAEHMRSLGLCSSGGQMDADEFKTFNDLFL